MKPVGLSRGRGISLVDDISAVSYGEAYVIQRSEFDLRLYVCVNSFSPLEAFLYQEGFSRFSTEPYTNDASSRTNKFVHLTNSSIQKEQTSSRYLDGSSNFHLSSGGTKGALSELIQRLKRAGVDTSTLWARIVEVVLRSLFAVQESISSHPASFEMFGYDLLIDADLKPWLLEVNASPSLARENPLDSKVKNSLVADTLHLISPPYFDRTVWGEMARWRLSERLGERGRSSSTPSFASELCALLHGGGEKGGVGKQICERHARSCRYERIAPSAAWERIVSNRKGERQGGRVVGGGSVGGGGGPPMHIRGSLDRFL
ncbi:MAG: hypothetical protein SGPRY_009584 [Prymnesium sp.]